MSQDIRNFFLFNNDKNKKRKADDITPSKKESLSPVNEENKLKRLKKMSDPKKDNINDSKIKFDFDVSKDKNQLPKDKKSDFVENRLHQFKFEGNKEPHATLNQNQEKKARENLNNKIENKPINRRPIIDTDSDITEEIISEPEDDIKTKTYQKKELPGQKSKNKPIESPKKSAKSVKEIPMGSDQKPTLKDIAAQSAARLKTKHMNEHEGGDNKKSNIKQKKTGKANVSSERSEMKKPKKKSGDLDLIEGPLTGYTIVVTGLLANISREDLQELIKCLGGKIPGSVSKKTTMLVAGYKLEDGRPTEAGTKYKKAKEYDINIVNEDEFDDFIFKKTGKRLADGLTSFTMLADDKSTANKNGSKTDNNQMLLNQPKDGQKKTQELWTIKHAPEKYSYIIGNQQAIRELKTWLEDWEKVVIHGEKKEIKFKRGREPLSGGNINSRACLISGPPGIGKTTAARLVAKELGYYIIEKNASDIRNKAANEALLNHLITNKVISMKHGTQKFVILMDEVDGMSAGDRGGNAVLINAIKKTKVPIICICNDRMDPKVRTLANYCLDIKFQRPPKNIVSKRIAEIATEEGLSVDLNALEYLCESFGNDIRQILNFLEMYSKKSNTLKYASVKQTLSSGRKDEKVMISNFDAASRFLNRMEIDKMYFKEKLDLFFIDYSLIPLLIQENYLTSGSYGKACSIAELDKFSRAADYIARGDIVSRSIRTNNEWGLMPNFAFLSTIAPCDLVASFIPFPKFPEWFGKNSRARKITRESQELKVAMSPAITGTLYAFRQDYVQSILDLILYNLQKDGKDAIMTVLDIMEHYHLTPDMLKEHFVDLQGKNDKDPFEEISTQTKASLTRAYNQRFRSSIRKLKIGKRKGGSESYDMTKFDPDIDEQPITGVGELSADELNTEETQPEKEEIKAEVVNMKTSPRKKSETKAKAQKSKKE